MYLNAGLSLGRWLLNAELAVFDWRTPRIERADGYCQLDLGPLRLTAYHFAA